MGDSLDRFVHISSPWLTLIGERIKDNQGQIIDYWRVEKPDSAVIIPWQHGRLLLPQPTYRPGLGVTTWDFPGGRIPEGEIPISVVPRILARELGVTEIESIIALNSFGFAVNSSFSNQKLYGFVAQLPPLLEIKAEYLGASYPTTQAGINNLLDILTCLQCRAILLEWWLEFKDQIAVSKE